MTKKDIEDIIKIICPDDEDFEKPCISPMYLRKELETLALEQEPILDKMRAEINELPSYVAKFNGGDFAIHIDKEKVFEIIDKYKAESEE